MTDTPIDMMKPPEGWTAEKVPLGYRFRLLYRFAPDEKRDPAHYVCDVHYFPSSKEARVVGPGRISEKGKVSTGTLDVNALTFAHTRLPGLLLWLSKAAA